MVKLFWGFKVTGCIKLYTQYAVQKAVIIRLHMTSTQRAVYNSHAKQAFKCPPYYMFHVYDKKKGAPAKTRPICTQSLVQKTVL